MRKQLATIISAGALTALAGPAFAQVTSSSAGVGGAPPAAASADITLTGVVESSLLLEIDSATAGMLVSTGVATGTVDFGTFTTANPLLATADTANRSTAGVGGAFVAVDLSATVTFGGIAEASISLERAAAAGTAPDVPAGNLRYAAAGAAWNDVATDGTPVADPGSPIYLCGDGAAGGSSCTSGTGVDHQLAVFVPDTQAAGTFTTVVTYTASAP